MKGKGITMKLGKKILSLVLIIAMAITMIPFMSFTALADEVDESAYLEKSEKSEYMMYSGLYSEQFIQKYGYIPSINVQGYYNNSWIRTTYGNQGYNLSWWGLGNAKITPNAELVYGGHYVLLSYKVTAGSEINGGKIGISTDVQIGDNDAAPINVVKDEDSGKVVGFELLDNHTASWCSNLNAKYMCYFDGYMISSAIDGADFEPAATYWFGVWYDASGHVFSNIAGNETWAYIKDGNEVIGLNGIDSGMAVSWNVNQAAGESKTYYVLLGIGDATFKEKPNFEETVVPVVTEDGRATAVITNKVGNKEDAGNLTLSVITTDGKELTVGDAPLEDLTGQDTSPYLMTASFIDKQINARPGNYKVKTVRATNKGGMFTDYNFSDEELPATTVSLVPRTEGLDLRSVPSGFESMLYEGWEWDKDDRELYFFGLEQVSDEGIQLPNGVNVVVEEEGASINVTDENKAAITAEGNLTIKNQNPAEGILSIDAPVGIKSNGNVTIKSNMELNASETAIQVGPGGALTIEEGANLTVNLTSEDAIMFKTGENPGIRVNIPKNYIIVGGTIDESGLLVLDPGVTTLQFIDVSEVEVTYDFKGHGSEENVVVSVAKRSCLDRPEDPKAFGWSFQGWVTSSGEPWNFLTEPVMKKMTLFAKWTQAETIEKTTSTKTINTGIAKMKASTELVPEVQQEKVIVDELMANKAASTVPTTLRAAISNETYDSIAEEMQDGGKLIVGLNVDLVGCEVAEETATTSAVTISYDVHPWYQIMNEDEEEVDRQPISNEELNGKEIVFRLPLTEIAANYEYAKVRHYLEAGGEDLMYLPVLSFQEDGETEYFVNVTATQFSIFSMTFTNEKDEEEHISTRDGEEKNWWSFNDKGWKLRDGEWYNIQDNHLVKGWYFEEEDGNWYYLSPETGAMETGWLELNNNWFYFNPESCKQTWFIGEDGKYHYDGEGDAKPLGALYTGGKTPDGYDVDETGALIRFEEL